MDRGPSLCLLNEKKKCYTATRKRRSVSLMFLITEMFVKVRNVMQFRAALSVNSLRCSSQQAALRSNQASPVAKWDILAAVCIGKW